MYSDPSLLYSLGLTQCTCEKGADVSTSHKHAKRLEFQSIDSRISSGDGPKSVGGGRGAGAAEDRKLPPRPASSFADIMDDAELSSFGPVHVYTIYLLLDLHKLLKNFPSPPALSLTPWKYFSIDRKSVYKSSLSLTMARSASDATRFTATTPTASSKPIAPSTTIKNLGRGAIPGETPQQKIFRLRAAAAAARAGKESQFDKVVRVGRRWADRAHRATAYSLIGLTGKYFTYPFIVPLARPRPDIYVLSAAMGKDE